jgi:Methyltransferase domain
MRATRAVDFATSIGLSAIYFATAMRDNGGGTVIGSELVPEKVATAKRNLADAGLADYADIREGDARQTLRSVGGLVDFALIDGWPNGREPSLAREVIEGPGSSDPNGRLCDERQRRARLSAIRARPGQWVDLGKPAASTRHRT